MVHGFANCKRNREALNFAHILDANLVYELDDIAKWDNKALKCHITIKGHLHKLNL